MVLALLILYTAIIVISAICLLFKLQFRYWSKRNVPHKEPSFPFGNLGKFGQPYHMKDVFDSAYNLGKGKSPFAGLYFFTRPLALIIDLDLVQHILIKDFNKFHDRGSYYNERDDPLSAHLVSLRGSKWKNLRVTLTPTFTSGKMKFMFPTILKVMDEFDEVLRDQLRIKSDVEMTELLARFTTDVIGTCAFGIECHSLKDSNTEFRVMGKKLSECPRHSGLVRDLIRGFPDLARKLGVKITRDDVSDFFLTTVRETVKYREQNNVRRKDFMDLLIQLKDGKDITGEDRKRGVGQLSMEEIAAQALIFFIAGYETSSTNMAFTLFELATNPDIQDNARNEIMDVLERYDGKLTYEGMMEMQYIDRIIHESLRKYPPFLAVSRIAECDYNVPKSDKVIQKGVQILISILSIHRDPDIYPNPDVFDPDRFLPEEIKKRHPMAFLGFGDGPRNCIGARFGLMQSRIGIISLLKNYRFSVCNKTPEIIEFKNSIPILSAKGGLWLNVEVLDHKL